MKKPVFLRAAITLLICGLATIGAWAESVTYMNADGTTTTTDATPLTGSESMPLAAGTYVVNSNITYASAVSIEGNVTIILSNGYTMNVGTSESPISGSGISGGTLTIYGQTFDDATAGHMNVYADVDWIASIAANYVQYSGNVKVVNSGGPNEHSAIEGNVNIYGGNLNASGSPAIKSTSVSIIGGKITTTGSIYAHSNGTITLSWTNVTDYINATSINGNLTFTKTFFDQNGNKYDSNVYISGKILRPVITLYDNADNTTAINNNNGDSQSVWLSGRTLYKDGKWNTLCLPFDVTISESPLKGGTVMIFDKGSTAFDSSTGTLTLNFAGGTSGIVAGTPFIIKWDSGTNLTEKDLYFTDVIIDKTARNLYYYNSENGWHVNCMGTYAPITYDSEDKSILFLGENNTLYYPHPDLSNPAEPKYPTIGAFRAYFELTGLTAGTPAEPSPIKSFVLNFDGETTGIENLTLNPSREGSTGTWYDLNGRMLTKQPTAKGVYVKNGRKVVVK